MRTFVIDIDGTICVNTFGEYDKAKPIQERIDYINKLYNQGNQIKFFTARGSGTGIDWRETTEFQLKKWGVKYHELILGKPEGDIFLDDKAFNVLNWEWSLDFDNDCLNKHMKIKNFFIESQNALKSTISDINIKSKIEEIGKSMQSSLLQGGKILFAGNGGSFSDAQHLSAELISKLNINRNPLSSLALGTNTSTFSAIGNDYGFENVFAREFEGIVKKQDLLIAISTSGNSENIYYLLKKSEELKIPFYVLTGLSGGKCSQFKDKLIKVPSSNTAVIQQIHILIGHILCDIAQEPFLNLR